MGRVIDGDSGLVEDRWIKPEQLSGVSLREAAGMPPAELTPEQKDRIAKCQWHLRRYDDRPLAVWYDNFAKDMNPEHQIRHFERVVKTMKAELPLRPKADNKGKKLLYMACILWPFPSVEALITAHPQFKSLHNIARVYETMAKLCQEEQE
jgi:hypothetical protein